MTIYEKGRALQYNVREYDGLVLKIQDSEEPALREFNHGRMLKRNGISVPEYHALMKFDPRSPSGSDEDIWCILMDYVEGVDMADLPSNLRGPVAKKYYAELEKVLALGIIPDDGTVGKNAIYDVGKKRLWLIDFEFYKKGTPKEISEFMKEIRSPLERVR